MKIIEFRCCGCGKIFEKEDNGQYPSCSECGVWNLGDSKHYGGIVRVGSVSELYHWLMRDDVCPMCDQISEDILFFQGPIEKAEPVLIYNLDGSLSDACFSPPIIKACMKCAEEKIALGWESFKMEYGKFVRVTQA